MPPDYVLSNADVALLALLCEERMHAWKLEKVVEYRDTRFWTDLSQSTIYKQLRALEKAGLVESVQEVSDGRMRKVYSITPSGRTALVSRLRELLSEPEHLKWRVDLGTYNLSLLPKKQALSCLKAYRAKLLENIEDYRRLEEFMKSVGCSAVRLAVSRRPVYLLEAETRWLDDFSKELQKN